MVEARTSRHRSFVFAVLGLWVTQAAMHAGWWLDDAGLAAMGQRAGLVLLMALIGLATTRISMVVVNLALEEAKDERRFIPRPPRRNLATATLVIYAVADAVVPGHAVAGWLALAAAVAQMDLLTDYHVGRPLFRSYVLPVYVTHLWIAVGLFGLGVDALGGFGVAGEFVHALGIGAVGTSILAVLTIAGLRHTGRELVIERRIKAAFVLVFAAAVLRVAIPLLVPGQYMGFGVHLPGALWMAAFALYLSAFRSRFVTPRPDGKPG